MPELPEVETIKRDLHEHGVVGSRIERAEILDPALVEGGSPAEFAGRLSGTAISGARRRAKHLVVELDSGDAAVFQLKIGGQLLLVPPVEEPTTVLMLVLHLDGDRKLFLRDETGYTRARVVDRGELEERFSSLGPEPMGDGFGEDYLRDRLSSRRAQIKPLLLDQKVVAGIGNIYADEILYAARLHPRRKANSLSRDEWDGLHAAILQNLRAGIEHRGTTFSLYRDVLGRKGRHQEYLRVFLRAGKPCSEGCGGKVVKEQVGGRATFLCPACQSEDGPKREQALTLV
ncbi:MAG TPA: bifunctional DNA-formamidopyrimidine glycosylase/DNA-(apurinic or apyrimidinic site) lyase [Rubrobacteraceae bacterium]|nr:bifunctional DNA-formamidopyrimidine glycosylase/DNA-(apurinic or apyrimidinic site) lyase [Rubrobacteraceae bacterium]